MSDCPDQQTLEAAIKGALPDTASVESHLEHCAGCRQKMDALSGLADFDPSDLTPHPDKHTEADIAGLTDLLKTQGRFTVSQPAASAVATADLLAPTGNPDTLGSLGPYQVLSEIARGGMGVVYKARDPNLDRTVAIKVLAPSLAENSAAHARFMREGRAAASLDHDNILPVYNVEPADPLPFLVMPFVDGPSLQQWIDEHGPLPHDQLLAVAKKITAGLAAAHANGIVHRDLKPANILTDNELERVWVTDFGLARLAENHGLTLTANLSGTPHYMAPEQVEEKTVDHRADLFSLGATLYALATGRPPFRGDSMAATLHQVTTADPPPPENTDPAIASIIARLLQKDPAKRYQTADEVLRALGDPKAAPPANDRRPLALLVGTVVPIVIAIVVWATIQGNSTPDIATATNGQVIGVTNNIELTHVDFDIRNLTIHATPGSAPSLAASQISTSANLWIENLTINHASADTPLFKIDTGTLYLSNCHITSASGSAPLIQATGSARVELVNNRIDIPGRTLVDTTGGARILLLNNHLTARSALALTSPQESTYNIELRRNTLVTETAIAGHPEHGDHVLEVFARHNHLAASQALLFLPAATESKRLSWTGVGNTYAIGRWYIHGFKKNESHYSGLKDFEKWLTFIDATGPVQAVPGTPHPESTGFPHWLGPGTPLEAWQSSDEGKSWRTAAQVAAGSLSQPPQTP